MTTKTTCKNIFSWGIDMLSQEDKKKLEVAQQSMDAAHKAITELYKAESTLLAEHAYDFLEPLAKMNQKLQRLLSVTK